MKHLKSFFIILMLATPSLAFTDDSSGDGKSRPPITLQKGNGSGHYNDENSEKDKNDGSYSDKTNYNHYIHLVTYDLP